MKKPEPKQQAAAYDWHEIAEYIKKKYKRDVRDWAGRWGAGEHNESKPYQDFWHWLIDNYEPTNGGYFTIDLPSHKGFKEFSPDLEPWIEEILNILEKEFPQENNELRCWSEW